jgi:hypothetical protein
MFEWIRDEILKWKVLIQGGKMFQGKLGICAADTLLKLATIQMAWSFIIVPSLAS